MHLTGSIQCRKLTCLEIKGGFSFFSQEGWENLRWGDFHFLQEWENFRLGASHMQYAILDASGGA